MDAVGDLISTFFLKQWLYIWNAHNKSHFQFDILKMTSSMSKPNILSMFWIKVISLLPLLRYLHYSYA